MIVLRPCWIAGVALACGACALDIPAFPTDPEIRDAGSFERDAAPIDAAAAPICGDGALGGAETCDDGNTRSEDGCDEACQIVTGWVCVPGVAPSRCFYEPETAFADNDCVGSAAGTFDDPDCSVSTAVARRLPTTVVLPGTYFDTVFVDGATELVGIGAPTIHSPSGTALTIGSALSVSVRGLILTGVDGGVVLRNASASITDCVIGPSGAIGLRVLESTRITLARTRVLDNAGGGVELDGALSYQLSNNVIARNEGFGGVFIQRSPSGSVFFNNTVADNSATALVAGGVTCAVPTVLANSIFWNNTGDEASGVNADCYVQYALIQTAPVLGTNLLIEDPRFTADYHLDPMSPAIDRGDRTKAPGDDIDGEPRPLGADVDLGADEAR